MQRLSLITAIILSLASTVQSNEPADIGSRRELFIDNYLIDSMKNVELKFHEPVRREIAIQWDKPWEGCGSGYTTVFHDGDKYRMYYKSWQHSGQSKKCPHHRLVIGYAESDDGITWKRPDLGLFEFNGSTENNIVLNDIKGTECHDFSPFVDNNPKAAADARFKAIGFGHGFDLRGVGF